MCVCMSLQLMLKCSKVVRPYAVTGWVIMAPVCCCLLSVQSAHVTCVL